MRSARLLVAAMAVGLSCAGCALVEDPGAAPSDEASASTSAEPTPSGSPSDEPTDLPTGFAAEQETVFPETNVYAGEVVDRRVLTMTLNAVVARELPDLATSYQLGVETGGANFVDLATQDGDGYVLEVLTEEGAGTAVGRSRLMVKRFDLESGSVDGEVEGEQTRDPREEGRPVFTIAGVVGSVVLVESAAPAGRAGDRSGLVALDVDSGEELWQLPGAHAVSVSETMLVVSTGTEGRGGRLSGHDPLSGRQRWTALEDVRTATEVGLDRRRLTVVTASSALQLPVLRTLSLRDGSELAYTPVDDADWTCHPAESELAVCSLPERHAIGYDLRRGKVVWKLPTPDRYGVWVTAVAGDRVYGFTSNGKPVVLEAGTGRDVGEEPGASPVSVGEWGGLVLYGGRAVFYPPATGDASDAPTG